MDKSGDHLIIETNLDTALGFATLLIFAFSVAGLAGGLIPEPDNLPALYIGAGLGLIGMVLGVIALSRRNTGRVELSRDEAQAIFQHIGRGNRVVDSEEVRLGEILQVNLQYDEATHFTSSGRMSKHTEWWILLEKQDGSTIDISRYVKKRKRESTAQEIATFLGVDLEVADVKLSVESTFDGIKNVLEKRKSGSTREEMQEILEDELKKQRDAMRRKPS